jgi:hypothetical protein
MTSSSLVLTLVASLAIACPAAAQTFTTDRTDYASRAGARGITTADFNRDGWPDFATAHEGPNGVSVMINRGAAGGFTSTFVPLAGGPFDLAAGDLNRDGIVDLAVANADGNTIDILFGAAGGAFAAPVSLAAPVNPRGITLADVDKDARLDIVYTGWQTNTLHVLYGDGAGHFAVRTGPLTTCPNPQGVAPADFNLDGRVDLAVACNGGVGVSVFSQGAGGAFTRQDASGYPSQNVIATGDFNRDGRPDIAAVSTNGQQLQIYLNHAGGFAAGAVYSVVGSPRGIAVADLNRDGALDAAVASRASSTVTVLFGAGDTTGSFGSPVQFAAGAGSRVVALADFDRDGRIDLATGNENTTTATTLTNTTAFPQVGFAYHRSFIGTESRTARGDQTNVVADFDLDGRLDIVTDHSPRGITALMADGQQLVSASDEPNLTSAKGVDLNGDAYLDLVATRYPASGYDPYEIVTFVNDGTGRFSKAKTLSADMWAYGFSTGDVNRDGHTDLVMWGLETYPSMKPFVRVLLSDGAGSFTQGARIDTQGTSHGVVIADVNRDGIPDVVSFDDLCGACGTGEPIEVFTGDGRGGFSLRDTLIVPWESLLGLTAGDVNADGYTDLVATGIAYDGPPNYGIHYEYAVLLGTATGFADPQTRTSATGAYGIGLPRLLDLDLDGRLDIVTNTGEFMRGLGDGTFATSAPFDFQHSSPLVAADFNRDGIIDLEYIQYDDYAAILTNQRQSANTAPTIVGRSLTYEYDAQFGDEALEISTDASDADLHRLAWEWRDAQGQVVSTDSFVELPQMAPGTHQYTATVRDGRGGEASAVVSVTINPMPELVLHVAQNYAYTSGSWEIVQDASAASGLRLHDQNLGAAKVTQPSASPSSFGTIDFVADPTQTYKLWVRLKADNNYWANDSVWIQVSGAVDQAGNPIGAPGTTSGIEVNLEECSGCGVSGWGWRDESWGHAGAVGMLTLRFPKGGYQSLRFQTREDGVSIDQFVLSAEKYRATRPGTVKNDNTVLPPTLSWQRY